MRLRDVVSGKEERKQQEMYEKISLFSFYYYKNSSLTVNE
jgi:hypothetical protein